MTDACLRAGLFGPKAGRLFSPGSESSSPVCKGTASAIRQSVPKLSIAFSIGARCLLDPKRRPFWVNERLRLGLLRTFSLKRTNCRIQSVRCYKVMHVLPNSFGGCGMGKRNRLLSLSAGAQIGVNASGFPRQNRLLMLLMRGKIDLAFGRRTAGRGQNFLIFLLTYRSFIWFYLGAVPESMITLVNLRQLRRTCTSDFC